MAIDQAIANENAAQTRRLEELVRSLTDAELVRDLGDGWTPAVALAHAAFWDRRAVQVFTRWVHEGTPYRDQDDDVLNTALLDEWQALAPRVAAELAVSAAYAVDGVVASLSERIVNSVISDGNDFLLKRSNHRREHIEQIEEALKGV